MNTSMTLRERLYTTRVNDSTKGDNDVRASSPHETPVDGAFAKQQMTGSCIAGLSLARFNVALDFKILAVLSQQNECWETFNHADCWSVRATFRKEKLNNTASDALSSFARDGCLQLTALAHKSERHSWS